MQEAFRRRIRAPLEIPLANPKPQQPSINISQIEYFAFPYLNTFSSHNLPGRAENSTHKRIFVYLKNDIKQIKVEKRFPTKHLIVLENWRQRYAYPHEQRR